MKEYYLKADEPVYYETEWGVKKREEDDKLIMSETSAGRVLDPVEGMRGFYWVESPDRDDVLAVPDFMTGEECLLRLSSGEETFESLEDEQKYVKIVKDKSGVIDEFA